MTNAVDVQIAGLLDLVSERMIPGEQQARGDRRVEGSEMDICSRMMGRRTRQCTLIWLGLGLQFDCLKVIANSTLSTTDTAVQRAQGLIIR